MSKVPLVSVVITAYNRAHTITRAIASVQHQALDDWEIILVDDASEDDLARVVENLGEPRLRLIRNQQNRGIGGAKNVGIEHARGRFVAFLDSDDNWEPGKLVHQVAALEAEPGVPLCFTSFWVERQNGRRVLRRPRIGRSCLDALVRGETTSLGSTLLATRECFAVVGGFNEEIARMQDREWLFRYIDHYERFLLLSEPMCTVTNSGWPAADRVEDSVQRLLECVSPRLERHGRSQLARFRASLQYEIFVAHYRDGSMLAGLPELLRALIASPAYTSHLLARAVRKLREFDLD